MAKAKVTISKPKKRTEKVDLKSLKIQGFDTDNAYPQRTEDITNDSGTTKSCIRLKSKYVSGSSFTDPNLGSVTLNRKGLNTDKLRKKLAWCLNQHGGGVIHFNYNGLGQKTEINFIPFPFGRLTLDDSDVSNRVAIYNNWDGKNGKFDKNKIKYINKYDRFKVFEQVEAEEVKTKGDEDELETLAAKFDQYEGQVLYWTPDGPDKYPLAPFDEVLEDCITEAQTKRFKSSTSGRNFMPSHYVVSGREEVETDEDGNAVESEGGLGEVLKQFQGSEEAAQIIHIEKDHDEEPFDIVKMDIQDYDAKLKHTEDSASEDIVRAFNIPDILVLRREGGLGGNGSELYEAKVYLNDVTQTERDEVSAIIEECFKGFVGDTGFTDFSIEPLKHKKPIAADSFQYYSKNEIRKDQGHEEVEETEGDKQMLAVTLGVGGTQSLTAIVNDPVMGYDAKFGTISVLFGLSDGDISKMLGPKPIG